MTPKMISGLSISDQDARRIQSSSAIVKTHATTSGKTVNLNETATPAQRATTDSSCRLGCLRHASHARTLIIAAQHDGRSTYASGKIYDKLTMGVEMSRAEIAMIPAM